MINWRGVRRVSLSAIKFATENESDSLDSEGCETIIPTQVKAAVSPTHTSLEHGGTDHHVKIRYRILIDIVGAVIKIPIACHYVGLKFNYKHLIDCAVAEQC